MDSVYIITKNFQTMDSDGWDHWKDSTNISYHKTLEGANAKISKLIELEVEKNEKCRTLNSKDLKKYFDDLISGVKDNKIFISEGYGTGRELIKYPLFEVVTVALEE